MSDEKPISSVVKSDAEVKPRGDFRSDNRGPGRFAGRPGGRRPRRGGEGDGDGGAGGNELVEKVVFINRSAKVVKGGRRFSFSALIVTGDKKGRVGVGLGKAGEVADAIRKGGEAARSNMVTVSLKGATLPHEAYATFCGAQVLLRPASPGTGIIAGKTVRAVLESAGVRDVLTKSLGSKNAANVVKATLGALRQLRLQEEIYKIRGLAMPKKVEVPLLPTTPLLPSKPSISLASPTPPTPEAPTTTVTA